MEVKGTKPRGRCDQVVSRRIWGNLVFTWRMHCLEENGEGKLRGHVVDPGSPER